MDAFKALIDLGFTATAILASGLFITILLKYIFAEVVNEVKSIRTLCETLGNRISSMNADIIRIDTLISMHLNLRVDVERIGRIDKKSRD